MPVDYLAGGEKTAFAVYGVKTASLKDVLHNARLQLVGRPVEAVRQVAKGELFHPEHGLYTHGLPRTPGHLAATLAIPAALTGLSVAFAPPHSRGETVGRAVGQLGGSILGGPLMGALGQVIGGMALSELGGTIGRQFDRQTAPKVEAPPEEPVEPEVAFAG